MKNQHITNALISSVDDNFKTKICYIDDICRAKKHLWAFGKKEHNEFLTPEASTKLFDELYDLDITALELIMKNYEKEINQLMILKLQTI